jgi:putative hydrolase of the HAD superfamily
MKQMKRIISALYFDLDQTLYEPQSGLLAAGDRLITTQLACCTGLTEGEADQLRQRLRDQYGTTARGLEVEYGIEQEGFYRLCYIDLNPADYLQPAPALATMIRRLPVPSYVVTNAYYTYAHEVLEALELADCFAGIFDIRAFNWRPKPDPAAYESVLQATGQPAHETVMIDDFAHNLPPAAALGMMTVYLGPGTAEADLCLTNLLDLPQGLADCGVTFRQP